MTAEKEGPEKRPGKETPEKGPTKSERTILMLVVIAFVFTVFISSYMRTYEPPDSDEPLTAREVWQDWGDVYDNETGDYAYYFSSFREGDVIECEDIPTDVNVTELPVVDMDWNDTALSTVHNTTETYTIVDFESGESLGFQGNRSGDFVVGNWTWFTLTVKFYDPIPYFFDDIPGTVVDEFLYRFHIIVEGVILYHASWTGGATLDVLEAGNGTAALNVSDIDLTFYPDWNRTWAEDELDDPFIRLALERDGELIEELVPARYVTTSSEGRIDLDLQARDPPIIEGDTIHVADAVPGNQTYTLTIYWRVTYPSPGLDVERVVARVDWIM